jgi:hypothetical protein
MNTTTDAVWSICNNPERIIDIYNGKSGKIIIHDSDIKDRLTYIMQTNSLLTRLEINPWSIGNYRGDTLWNKIDDNSLSILKNKSCHDVSCPDCPIKTMLDAPIPTCHATFGNRLFMCNATLIYLILKWGTKKTKELLLEALL